MNDTQKALLKAIEIVGSQKALARQLSQLCQRTVKQGHISNWLHRDKRVSVHFAIPIETIVKGQVTRHELRPDIYPEETVSRKD